MEKVYIIKTVHGYEYLMNLGITKKVFRSRERCEEIVKQLAEKQYGKPMFSEKSVFVKLVKQYWAGDFSEEELEEKIGSKEVTESAFSSALYYDFYHMFGIEELEIEE